MQRTIMDLWVGIFVILGVGALLILSLKVGNLITYGTEQSYTLEGNFDNIGGLKIRSPVKSAGVVVGRVTDIQFSTTTYDAVVTMDMDGRYQFPADTFASILTAGLLGEQYIGLDAGGDETMLEDGERIMITNSAIVLEEMISRFLFDSAADDDTNDDF
jgi:phospholipid/cholesterol/gamma-HCH transport system substrate-binding protein